VIYVDNRDYDEDRRYEDRMKIEECRKNIMVNGMIIKNIKEENRKNVTMMIGD
jgi:hypothetical protein